MDGSVQGRIGAHICMHRYSDVRICGNMGYRIFVYREV